MNPLDTLIGIIRAYFSSNYDKNTRNFTRDWALAEIRANPLATVTNLNIAAKCGLEPDEATQAIEDGLLQKMLHYQEMFHTIEMALGSSRERGPKHNLVDIKTAASNALSNYGQAYNYILK